MEIDVEVEVFEHEYLLIIEPKEVKQQIQAFKEQFKSYGFKNAQITPAHITVMYFLRYETYEHAIMKKLKQMAAVTRPFEVQLNGFGNFESTTSTIYINITTADPILNIVERKKREINPLVKGSKEAKPYYDSKPHITVARGLASEQLQQVWPDWRKESFEASFTAHEMVLLKKAPGGTYKERARFPFKGEDPGQFVQMSLFG